MRFYIHTKLGAIYFILLNLIIPTIAVADEVEIIMTEASSGGLYIHTELGAAIETDMLLDTGSSYTTLSQLTFDKVNEQSKLSFSRNIYGAMADGRVNQVPLYILDELVLADNCILKNIEVAVLQYGDIDILGLKALKLLQPFSIQLMPAKLSINNCAS